MRAVALAVAAIAAVAAVVAGSAAAAGTTGLLASVDAMAVAVLLTVLGASTTARGNPLPSPGRGPDAHPRLRRALAVWARRARRGGAEVGADATGFPAYRRIRSELAWATASRRHYHHSARPLLSRLLLAVLADRHRVDALSEPARARDLVGSDLWPLLDPARPASQDSIAPGVDIATLTRLVDRLEEL